MTAPMTVTEQDDKQVITASELERRLRLKYPADKGYIVLTEVRNGAAFKADSAIDAVVISTWPSSGLCRFAFEFKVSRGDFLREVNNPKKNRWCREQFHAFWFVTAKGVATAEEMPDGSGLMTSWGPDALRIERQAAQNPEPTFNDSLLAAMMKSAMGEAKTRSYVATRDEHQRKERVDEAMAWHAAAVQFLRERKSPMPPRWGKDETILKFLNNAAGDEASRQRLEDLRMLYQSTAKSMREMVLLLLPVFALEMESIEEGLDAIKTYYPEESHVKLGIAAFRDKRENKFLKTAQRLYAEIRKLRDDKAAVA